MTVPAPTPPERTSPRTFDVVLALVVALALAGVVTIQQAAAGENPDPLAYLFAAGFGALQLLRRSLPVAMLVLSVLGTFAYYTLQLPTIGVALPVVAALYSAAERGLLRWAISGGAVVFTVALAFRLRDDPQPLGYLLGSDAVTNLALIAGAIALGSAVRSHRRQIAQREQISSLHEERTRQDAQLRMRAERERISRDLHDTVGHSLSVISLHTGVARDAVGVDDAAVTEALEQVRGQATQSLQELRAMVHLLRTDQLEGDDGADVDAGQGDTARQVRSLVDVSAVLAPARDAGLDVRARVDVPAGALSVPVDSAAYRVVQESVTNVLRHATASTLRVEAGIEGGQLQLVVADDGRGTDGVAGSSGVGLVGMRERVRLLGGTLSIRSAPGEGFRMEASMPARLDRTEELLEPGRAERLGGTERPRS
ncbi:sensor histidine kinase [Brachybacterium sacelli]|uniref:Oxygen sensor histidine kinase NreB n=1 Tax=Brachybacterium sacelli TaxID=173364 RepID=A0ABS4WZR0_9MICO|nr:signal transduction histidine kinase [Brachybacterium sacelli]